MAVYPIHALRDLGWDCYGAQCGDPSMNADSTDKAHVGDAIRFARHTEGSILRKLRNFAGPQPLA